MGENELIFVNDGSTDASMNILEVIAQQNKNVRGNKGRQSREVEQIPKITSQFGLV